ncbi:uncharacterized protein LOC132871716 [Neoarius graeffei]|uniref:uncharacterized protein LOC132871716 n=1 Tax=Neoarius graeffei TaxID=443677 RepID=UPI00298CD870|nr:uncharacterized protein LOC132871716 [Neoarius graeffei]XP_060762133.1 uncharacterized protein LOC132871716 [Neoarius graeffei]XP_060762134.1 uncharacterized protein LOC132871716 [Neoarius graeffei]XP_060762135.1 uncharacterized protein LOC132871716 [Neoarius graeffei]XP_060762136.1 uncharacterized protein LOC132871716 [Neoarius graeffei]XP_060762137.1 uncharacterized protein LOC132871716 [Neoarius graeffei]XP_060762138.1 uncharacterized protein LOC132871716 [Neoarius graeffei]XP_06076213
MMFEEVKASGSEINSTLEIGAEVSLASANEANVNVRQEETEDMEATCSVVRRRQHSSPSNVTVSAKKQKGMPKLQPEFVSNVDVLAAIQNLTALVEDFGAQLKQNNIMIANVAKAAEFNAANIKEGQEKTKVLENAVRELQKENLELKEKTEELERYQRRWNLRLNGLPETEGENTRQEVAELIARMIPEWSHKMDIILDTVHRLGKPKPGKTHQIILQFTSRTHHDALWKQAKDDRVCAERKVRFKEDLTKAGRNARNALWPKIERARQQGMKAFFRGPFGFINGQCIQE